MALGGKHSRDTSVGKPRPTGMDPSPLSPPFACTITFLMYMPFVDRAGLTRPSETRPSACDPRARWNDAWTMIRKASVRGKGQRIRKH